VYLRGSLAVLVAAAATWPYFGFFVHPAGQCRSCLLAALSAALELALA